MKKTIQEIRNKLVSKELLSEHDLLRLRGGDGEEDKRKDIGGGSNMNSNFGGNGIGDGNAGGSSTTGNNPGGG